MAIELDKSNIIEKANMILAKPFIGIMHTNRMDMLMDAIQSVKSFDGHILVLNNSKDCEMIPTVRNHDTWGQGLRYIKKTVVNPIVPLTYSQSMNYFRGLCIRNENPYYFVMHEDALPQPGVLEKLQERAKLCTLNKERWGVMFTNEDSLMVINGELVKELMWDTTFSGYFADTDFYYWARQKGYELIETRLPVKHPTSSTINADPQLNFKNNVTYQLYLKYYVEKNGGKRDGETFTIPFNNQLFKFDNYLNG